MHVLPGVTLEGGSYLGDTSTALVTLPVGHFAGSLAQDRVLVTLATGELHLPRDLADLVGWRSWDRAILLTL